MWAGEERWAMSEDPERVTQGRLNFRAVQIKFGNASVQQPLFLNCCRFLFVIPREGEGSAGPRTSPGNAEAEYDAPSEVSSRLLWPQLTRGFWVGECSPTQSKRGLELPTQSIGAFIRRLVICLSTRLPGSLREMGIQFEHHIPRFQERSAELQIPRLRSG
jgi:hypothetical protein